MAIRAEFDSGGVEQNKGYGSICKEDRVFCKFSCKFSNEAGLVSELVLIETLLTTRTKVIVAR